MVDLLKVVIFHGYVSHNQRVTDRTGIYRCSSNSSPSNIALNNAFHIDRCPSPSGGVLELGTKAESLVIPTSPKNMGTNHQQITRFVTGFVMKTTILWTYNLLEKATSYCSR